MSYDRHNDDPEYLLKLIRVFADYLEEQTHNINKTSDLVKAYQDFFKGQLKFTYGFGSNKRKCLLGGFIYISVV